MKNSNKKFKKVRRNRINALKISCGWNRGIFLIFLGGFLFRLFAMARLQFAVTFDEAHYVRLAKHFLEIGWSGVLHPYWPPFYPMTIAFFHVLGISLETAGRLVSVLMGTLTIGLVYWLAKTWFGPTEAKWSAFLYAFYPPVVLGSTHVMPESLFSFLALLGMVLAWQAFEKKWLSLGILAGILWSFCYLVKPEGVGFLLVFLAYGIGVFLLFPKFSKPLLKRAGIMWGVVVGWILIALPYLIFLRQNTGTWTLSTKGTINQQFESAVYFQDEANPDPFFHLTQDNRHLPYDMAYHFGTIRELTQMEEGKSRIVRIHPGQLVHKFVKNFYHEVKTEIPKLFGIVPFVLFVAGLLGFRPKEKSMGLFFLYLLANVFFFWFLLVPLFHLNERYFIPLFPLFFTLMGKGLLILSQWVSEFFTVFFKGLTTSRNRVASFLVWIFVIGFGFLPEWARWVSIRAEDPDAWADPVELKIVGNWLKTHSEHPPVLMSLNKAVDFYAGQYDMKKGASYSYDSVDRNVEYARHRGVEYLVFSSRYLFWFPNLKPLIEKKGLPQGLRLEYELEFPKGIHTVVYRLESENRRYGEKSQ